MCIGSVMLVCRHWNSLCETQFDWHWHNNHLLKLVIAKACQIPTIKRMASRVGLDASNYWIWRFAVSQHSNADVKFREELIRLHFRESWNGLYVAVPPKLKLRAWHSNCGPNRLDRLQRLLLDDATAPPSVCVEAFKEATHKKDWHLVKEIMERFKKHVYPAVSKQEWLHCYIQVKQHVGDSSNI